MSNGKDFSEMSMLDLFRMEAESHCLTISDNLLALEQNPTAADLLESLMRASHSVKGAARVVGLDLIVQVAHSMEDVFVAAQSGKIRLNRAHIDTLLKGVDIFNEVAAVAADDINNWLSSHKNEIDVLVSAFVAIASQQEAPPAPVTKSAPEPAAAAPAAAEPPPRPPLPPINIADMSMMDLFRLESETHCGAISEKLLALEQEPGNLGALEGMMRAAHSLKGAARIVEIDMAVHIAHAMEDVFVAGQKKQISINRNSIDLLLKGVDLLQEIAKLNSENAAEWMSGHSGDIDNLVNALALLARPKAAVETEKKTVITMRPEPAPAQKAPESAAAKKSLVDDEPTKQEALKKEQLGRRAEDRGGVRAIRISAENMNRLMGLAGEVLIESRWLPSFALDMLRLKHRQDELLQVLDKISESIDPGTAIKTVSEIAPGVEGVRLVDLRNKVAACRDLMSENLSEIEDHARRATEISNRLYREVIASRMRPFSDGITAFPRLVRDLSRELNKEVRLEIIGSDTLVDRDILEKIEAPLNHMIRNALDHGIETPAEREKLGKPREATLQLEARHSSGMLNIIVRDDGRGVDLEKLRRTIVKKGMVAEEMAVDLTKSELIEFLFLPNFSTKDEVSKVSGRGVGLDVVHNVINEVRGVVRSSTKENQGSSFEMQLPLTLSVLRALLVEIGREPYAVPLVNIDHILTVPKTAIKMVEGREYFTFNEKRIGLMSAQQMFEKKSSKPEDDDKLLVIIFSDRLNQYGLTVENFYGIRDLVVQTLDKRLGKVKDISSAAILEDGTPILVVDVEDLVRSMDNIISGGRLERVDKTAGKGVKKEYKRILVADDSITVREVERKMLKTKGYMVDVAVDGMDAWNSVRNNPYHLVVTDVDMPRMDGIELVTMIRNDPHLNSLPIIIVSYKDRDEDRSRGLEAGADYYLTKGSFQDETLVRAVQDLIGGPDL